jgi:hypothetical protein
MSSLVFIVRQEEEVVFLKQFTFLANIPPTYWDRWAWTQDPTGSEQHEAVSWLERLHQNQNPGSPYFSEALCHDPRTGAYYVAIIKNNRGPTARERQSGWRLYLRTSSS